MKKKTIYLILAAFLIIFFPNPLLAANEVTFESGVNIYLSGLGIYLDVSSGGTVDSITVNTTTIDITMSAGSKITLTSSDGRTLSASDAGFSSRLFSCPASGSSSLALEKASGDAAVTTISISSSTCTAETTPGASTSGGGGGGGAAVTLISSIGSGISTVTIAAGGSGVLGTVTSKGTNAVMGSNASASFNPMGDSGVTSSHNIKVKSISDNTVTVEISSETKTLEISLKKTKQVDLDGDGFNDLLITFNQVTSNRADLTLKEIKVVKISGLTPGGLVKRPDMSAVYYYGKDSKRYVFPNDKAYFTWYSDFKEVKTISADNLAKLSIGQLVTYKAGVKMVKIQTDPKVYAVSKGGVLRWVKTEALAKELYGENWNQQIDDVVDSFFTSYTIGDPIETAADFNKETEITGTVSISDDKDLL